MVWNRNEQNMNNMSTAEREREREWGKAKDGLRLIASVGRGSEQFWNVIHKELEVASCHTETTCASQMGYLAGREDTPAWRSRSFKAMIWTISIISNDEPPYVYSAHHEHTLMGDGASQRNNCELQKEKWSLILYYVTFSYFFQAGFKT